MQENGEIFHPKCPDGTKNGREKIKIQHTAADHSQQDVQSKLALSPPQKEKKECRQDGQAIEYIPQPGRFCAAQAEGA